MKARFSSAWVDVRRYVGRGESAAGPDPLVRKIGDEGNERGETVNGAGGERGCEYARDDAWGDDGADIDIVLGDV